MTYLKNTSIPIPDLKRRKNVTHPETILFSGR